jgi:hypothetical protein
MPTGLGELILDRLHGFLAAFSATEPNSYVAAFGPAAYLVAMALLVAAAAAVGIHSAPRMVGRPAGVLFYATCVAGVTLLVPVHLAHTTLGPGWLFGHRHGLPLILLVTVALSYLVSRPPPIRAPAVALLLLSLLYGGALIVRMMQRPNADPPTASEHALGRWLDSLPAGTTVLTTKAQGLSLVTRVGLHATFCPDTPASTRMFLAYVGVDFVVAYPDDEHCRFLADAGRDLRPVKVFDDGVRRMTVFAPVADMISRKVQGPRMISVPQVTR